MKKLILLELTLLFLATTFQSHNPPGWYQQQLPVNDFVNDIFFLDSLNGWVGTNSNSSNDTGYILRTSDGGNNWVIQLYQINSYNSIQFLNLNEGFAATGWNVARVFKTTNGGNLWFEVANFGLGFGMNDINFINKDTGWITSSDIKFGGIWKTTNGGNSWVKQLSPPPVPTLSIKAISILNKDTGWAINSSSSVRELYRTTNGGTNWNVQYTFSSGLGDVFFFNSLNGVISSGRFYYTTDGGFSWTPSQSKETGGKLSFPNDSIGWAGFNLTVITKTTNAGVTWFYQTTNVNNPTPFALSSLNAWAGGNKLIHTSDGGGLSSIIETNTVPNTFTLYQNYPNPFNPQTNISYELQVTSHVILKVFDIQGKEIKTLVNQKQSSGSYKIEFDARLANEGTGLNSGIYFYRIEVSDERGSKKYVGTKTMILVK